MNVRDFGAVGNGRSADDRAVQAAIDAASAQGGGRVIVPAGRYRCGTLHLRSGVELHLEAGAVILAAKERHRYPVIALTANLPGQIQALIWGEGVTDIAITGSGTIDGGGGFPLDPLRATFVRFRPAMVVLRDCKNVQIETVTLRHARFWTLHLLRCEDVVVGDVTIRNQRWRINTDGIDPDGCRNVTISGCDIDTGDDAIVLKSTEGDVCANISVRDCRLCSAHAALKIGTEALADIRDIVFEDCRIEKSNIAVALYMKDGSVYERIAFRRLAINATGAFPLVIDVTPRDYRQPAAGTIRAIHFEDIDITASGRAYIEGDRGQPVHDVAFHNVTWQVLGPFKPRRRKPAGSRRVRRDPQQSGHARRAYQVIAVNVEGLVIDKWQCIAQRAAGQVRGLLYLLRCANGRIDNVVTNLIPPEGSPLVQQSQCDDIRLGDITQENQNP